MIDARFARTEILRFKILDKWLDQEESRGMVNELVLALQAAHNEFVAGYVVNEWLARNVKLPTPAHLRSLIWEENEKIEKSEPAKRAAHCATCKDEGVIGGVFYLGKASECRWCSCASALKGMELVDLCPDGIERNWVDRVNEANRKIRKLMLKPTERLHGAAKQITNAEEYNGDF